MENQESYSRRLLSVLFSLSLVRKPVDCFATSYSLSHTHTHILLLTFFFFLFLSFSSSSSSIFTVSRFVCQSDLYDMSLTLDVNVEIYPMDVSERFKMLLTKDVNLGTATDKNGNVWEVSRR